MSEQLQSADIERIQRILPHRYPFLLVDRVEAIDGIRSARGIKMVTMNEPHFQGHFPGRPVMPGVTIVEAMAQTAGVMVGAALGFENSGMLIYFMAIESCKFRRMVVPGDVLVMDIETLRGRPDGRVFRMKGTARVGDDVACEAVFTAMLDRGGEG